MHRTKKEAHNHKTVVPQTRASRAPCGADRMEDFLEKKMHKHFFRSSQKWVIHKKNSESKLNGHFATLRSCYQKCSTPVTVNLIKCEHFETWETTSLPKENLILLQKGDLMLSKVAKNNRVFPLRTINLHDPQGWFGYYKLQQFWSLSFICAHI